MDYALDPYLSLGIEFGSTRIKGVLIDGQGTPVATGAWEWENRLEDGYWTYALKEIWEGLQGCFRNLAEDYHRVTGQTLTRVGALGVSGMMHGYLAFNDEGRLLVPFRTWRNTTTGEAAARLTRLFGFNIPQRWSIAHLYQAILDKEPHVTRIGHITTLAGYVHEQLTGRRVMGIGEASGMFPIDSAAGGYDGRMTELFNGLLRQNRMPYTLQDILPEVLAAGEEAGVLTAQGAALLDPTGVLQPGARLCPPEGDAGTGMVATNSIAPATGNISAGTSIFAMVVLEKALSGVYGEIDMVATPDGSPVAMVHCNNCTSDLNAWADLIAQAGGGIPRGKVLDGIFEAALSADKDGGGLLSYNYFSGEPITGVDTGRPLFVRLPDARFTFANFSRTLLYASLATLKLGMDILSEKEHVRLSRLLGHGGFFKSRHAGQAMMAAALNVPVSVMETASEGGAWGMALLARYCLENTRPLAEFLDTQVFANSQVVTVTPDPEDVKGFQRFMDRYTVGLEIEKNAAIVMK